MEDEKKNDQPGSKKDTDDRNHGGTEHAGDNDQGNGDQKKDDQKKQENVPSDKPAAK